MVDKRRKFICDYRGHDINFDTESETFYVNGHDWQQEKKSFAACKKEVDEYLKDNAGFEPFFIEPKIGGMWARKKYKVIGRRKDGRFVGENEKGEKEQISDSDRNDYVIKDPLHDPLKVKIKSIDAKMDELRKERDRLLKEEYHYVTLLDFANKYDGKEVAS